MPLTRLQGSLIAGNTISTLSIANSSITSEKIANSAVATVDIADGAITTEKIANSAIVTVDIADFNVTSSKLANSLSISGNLRIAGNIQPGIYLETFANVAIASGNIVLNLANATIFRTVVTGAANVILQNPPPANVGFSAVIQLFQTGSYAITWPTSIQWPTNTAPTLSTTNGYVDTIAIYTIDGGVNYYGTSVLGQF